MSKKVADVNPGPTRTSTATPRRQSAVRRAPTSARLAREARQTRLAYLALGGVIGLVIITLVVGALVEYIIGPAQPVATVNGATIRTDSFNRYQGFENFLLNNQAQQIQQQIVQLQSDKTKAAANAQIISLLTQQQQQIQQNQSNLPAYTLQSMEQSLEQQQAAGKIGAAPTPAQIDAAMNKLRKNLGGASGFNNLLSNTGVHEEDLRAYYVPLSVVQQNVTTYYSKRVTVPATEPRAKARHILFATKDKARATLVAQQLRQNPALFPAYAQKYSIDKSSAVIGGWLRDPSATATPAPTPKKGQKPAPAPPTNVPTWITPQTGFVAPVLNAILSMKPGEIRVVQSTYGYHVIQVTEHVTYHFTKKELEAARQQKIQSQVQAWQQSATDATKNSVNPPNPYTQFPQPTAGA